MQPQNFPKLFKELTGSSPFPWQEALFARFIESKIPDSANLPTGLGKTSIVAIWLCALALAPGKTPRRLVYVVNRRTVVDQTTAEAERLRDALNRPALAEVREALGSLCALPLPTPEAPPLAISTLRGQFADNREWCGDPCRPAIIVGTVDMIGSGLLFSRYTSGFKTRPLHAAFLGQDALLVHDEAHLEPAFQKLIESIVAAQNAARDPRKLRVIELTATGRTANADSAPPFTLTPADRENETVKKRLNATKRLSLYALGNGERIGDKLISFARQRAELAKGESDERAVLVFVRTVETALKVLSELDKGEHKGKAAPLTGTMRGKERDDLVRFNAVFQRFLPPSARSGEVAPATGTVFLVATSAGEVGVNLSADDLVCDLSTYESMAQRFGRVNRFGERDDSEITVVHETSFDTARPLEIRRERTLILLKRLAGFASPVALDGLPTAERAAAFSPEPDRRVATEIQFDAWALTSIREPIAARPAVAPYLHGEAEWQPPETSLAWRDDRDFRHIQDPEAFLEDFPLKPVELLHDTTARIVKTLDALLKNRLPSAPDFPAAWLIAENGSVSPFTLSDFDAAGAIAGLADATLLLPASVGGLTNGLFTSDGSAPAFDISEIVRRETGSRSDVPARHRLVCAVEISEEDDEEQRNLLYLKAITEAAAARDKQPQTLADHTEEVVANAAAIAAKCFPDKSALAVGELDLRRCIIVAACLHDLGKNRAQWQRNLGNLGYDSAKPETILAKSATGMRARNVAEHYRHEFGSLQDAVGKAEFAALGDAERDIVLHIVAAHHGRARPHFPADEIFDYTTPGFPDKLVALATEVPRRFARLQERFGRWGLAWLESVLRAADYAASVGIVATGDIAALANGQQNRDARIETLVGSLEKKFAPAATLAVNPANPGHYFACCGLFELAARLSPTALAWFVQDSDTGKWRFDLANTLPLADLLGKITAAEITALDSNDATASPLKVGVPFNLRLDWWKTAARDTAALKVWAGTMECPRIARAMQDSVRTAAAAADFVFEKLLFDMRIAYDTENPANKVEPFYFDANRGPNAHSRDVGFAVNDLKLETLAAPAVELLTLVGLQRVIPAPVPRTPRNFDYRVWVRPLPVSLLSTAVNGLLPDSSPSRLRFESWFRTGQRKHKAFLTARIISSR